MLRTALPSTLTLLATLALTLPIPSASAQSLLDRIDDVHRRKAAEASDTSTTDDRESEAVQRQRIEQRMGNVIEQVHIEDVPAKTAFEWWSRTSGINLVVHWDKLRDKGIDTEKRISLKVSYVPVNQCLSLLMKAIELEEQPLIFELTPWYVQVMTRAEADQRTVTRIYDITELMHEVPDFTDAPEFDLQSVLSTSQDTGSRDFFAPPVQRETRSKQEQAQAFIDLIKETIEPDVWLATGRITYFQGRLIITAPSYVHAQIGMSVAPPRRPAGDTTAAAGATSAAAATSAATEAGTSTTSAAAAPRTTRTTGPATIARSTSPRTASDVAAVAGSDR